MGNMILLFPVETTSSLRFRSVRSPQLSAQHLAYVGQHSQPPFAIATPCTLSVLPNTPEQHRRPPEGLKTGYLSFQREYIKFIPAEMLLKCRKGLETLELIAGCHSGAGPG